MTHNKDCDESGIAVTMHHLPPRHDVTEHEPATMHRTIGKVIMYLAIGAFIAMLLMEMRRISHGVG